MKTEWKTCFRVGISVFLLFLAITYWQNFAGFISALFGAATPLLVGCVIAYLINILMSFYERHYFRKSQMKFVIKSRRMVCLALAMITLVAVIVGVIYLIVPQLISCVQLIIAEVPEAVSNVVSWLDAQEFVPDDIIGTLSSIDWESKIDQFFELLVSGIGSVTDVVVGAVSSVFSGIVSALLGIIFSVYILLDKDKLVSQINRVMKRFIKKGNDKIHYVVSVIDDCFHRYVVGQCIEAVILGVLCAVGMLILGLPYAGMISALIAFTALIPVAGAYIGAGVGAFMIFTVSPFKALIFLIYIVVLQQLEGNLIYPRVVGSSMGLPGIWVLASVTVGGGLMGILGMLVGVPLAAVLYRLLREKVNAPELKIEKTQPLCVSKLSNRSEEQNSNSKVSNNKKSHSKK